VPGTNLFPDETDFAPRPAWQVIEAARRQHFTGELTLQTAPTTRVFMRDGVVYFAERSTDGALAIRLMMEGVITREQMQRGTLIVNGVEHVGRMFDADPSIDRSSVELCAELFTDDVMVDVANRNVTGYELVLYRRHPSGIDRWYPQLMSAGSRHHEPPVAEPVPNQANQANQPSQANQANQANQASPAVTESGPVAKPATKPMTEMHSEPRNKLDAPPITLAVPVTRPVTTITAPPPMATQLIPVTPLAATPPVTATRALPLTPPPAVPAAPAAAPSDDVDASTIADEVAEAIRRAFAGLGG
jgi:hypothetical protein